MERGVLILAYGDKYYLHAAWALLCTIRAHYPATLVHLVYDDSWTEPNISGNESEMISAFNSSSRCVTWDSSSIYCPKLSLYDLSPYNETLYLDADALIFPRSHYYNSSYYVSTDCLVESLRSLIPWQASRWSVVPTINGYYLADIDKTIGGPTYTYHGDPKLMSKHYCISILPNTSTGLIWFKKDVAFHKFMQFCANLHYSKSAPAFNLPGGTGRADEFSFNVAMGMELQDGCCPAPLPEKFQPMHFHRIHEVKSLPYLNTQYIGIQLGHNTLPEFVHDVVKEVLTPVYEKLNIRQAMRIFPGNKSEKIPWRKSF